MSTLFVKPNKAPVRNPDKAYAFLPAHGAKVPRNAFWLRRLSDKSVTEITEADFVKARDAAEKKATLNAKKKAAEKAKPPVKTAEDK